MWCACVWCGVCVTCVMDRVCVGGGSVCEMDGVCVCVVWCVVYGVVCMCSVV